MSNTPEHVTAARIQCSDRSVRERDLDNFLLEELDASPIFRAWFVGRLGSRFEVPSHTDITIGKNPQREVTSGQTDLQLAFIAEDRSIVGVILIESKVGNGFQPDQPERYGQEITALRERLGDHRAAAVVVAPRANSAVANHPCFDATILLEEIVDHLKARLDGELAEASGPLASELRWRLGARIGLIEALAGKRSYGTWTPNPIPERLGFMQRYQRLAERVAVGFKVTVSSGGPKASSALYRGPRPPGLAISQMRHDFGETQCASIVLPKSSHAETALRASHLLPDDATTDSTPAGSLIVRIPTPTLVPVNEHFDEQLEKVEIGVRTVLRLHMWAFENAEDIAVQLRGG